MANVVFLLGLLCLSYNYEVYGHGMMMDPINRSSVWRVNDSYPLNYEDNENFCGGMAVSLRYIKSLQD